MNKPEKGVLSALATITLVSEFCDCYWNKGHSPVGMAFEMDNSMCCSSTFCHKEHFKNRNIIKQHIPSCRHGGT
jgi:hypothetical protein